MKSLKNIEFIKLYDFLNEPINGIKLKQSEKIVFSLIENSCRIGKCYWSNAILAKYSGISERQIAVCINNLEKAGLIEKTFFKNNLAKRELKLKIKIKNDSNFIKIPVFILNKQNLTLNEKIIFSYILNKTNSRKVCIETNNDISANCNCTTRTVTRSIIKLSELKLLDSKLGKGNFRYLKVNI